MKNTHKPPFYLKEKWKRIELILTTFIYFSAEYFKNATPPANNIVFISAGEPRLKKGLLAEESVLNHFT